ncbi:uncharacterized protein Aud_000061 [Aspergillus udagawae]|uniref:Uncharacterized protein n=1 Tax=Aspergillus udagawae TaxID=91492 RepID=A0A8E0QHU7_9EURO|nr:uncharacterized protein Aud_000061 [Aspergillus udagawae]GIC84247.1 hypothetical protein Aud_000061 [Aspergillus udagawae]
MSSYPTSAEATGTTNVGNNKPIIEPASASWFTDYIMDVKLESKDGTDIPLYNEKLMTHVTQITNGGPYVIDRVHSDRWKLRLEGKRGSGQTQSPVGTTSPEKKTMSLKDGKVNTQRISSPTMWKNGGEHNRFVAVRCPKMDNPAIAVKVNGHYGGLHWVGLFVKSRTDDTNQFIAVRTTHRLLPDYAERTKKYEGHEKWYHPDLAVDLVDRTLTLFPKQLYGTKGNLPDLSDKFVTTDPENDIGAWHLNLGGIHPRYKYVWQAAGKTILRVQHPGKFPPWVPEEPLPNLIPAPGAIDYISGIKLREESVTPKGGGWTMQEEADFNGFVTAAGKAFDAYKKIKGSAKECAAVEIEEVEEVEKPNTADIPTIAEKIRNGTIANRDFGSFVQDPYPEPPDEFLLDFIRDDPDSARWAGAGHDRETCHCLICRMYLRIYY